LEKDAVLLLNIITSCFKILGPSKRIGSRVWPLRFTWRHRLRDHSIPIGGPLERSLYLQPFSRYSMANLRQLLTWP